MFTKTSFNQKFLLKVLHASRLALKTKRCVMIRNKKGKTCLMVVFRKGKFKLIYRGKTVNRLVVDKHSFFLNYF